MRSAGPPGPRRARRLPRPLVAMGLMSLAVLGGLGAVRSLALRTGPVRHEVLMRSVSFSPPELRVSPGDTVVWRNTDIVRHNAVRPELFDTGELRSGERYAWVVPSDTGTFAYRCTIHSRMRGRLIVEMK